MIAQNSIIRNWVVFCAFISALNPQIWAQNEPILLKFPLISAGKNDTAEITCSLDKIRGNDRTYSVGGLYLITHTGDREKIFLEENQNLIDDPWIGKPWRFCSVFAASSESLKIAGRNWDNQNVGSVIVNLCYPDNGYASVSFSRAIDLGFGENLDLKKFQSTPFGDKLNLAPFYAMDGVNEHGLMVAITGLKETKVDNPERKDKIFITYLIRKLLDQTKTVPEAVRLANKFAPFDLNQDVLNGHLFISDASGQSVVLEYIENRWQKIVSDESWQVLSTKPVYGVSEFQRKEDCWRYKAMSEALENSGGQLDWHSGMQILKDVHQIGTTWSVIYVLSTREIYFTVYQDWQEVYYIKPF
jgi:hypothetical protein